MSEQGDKWEKGEEQERERERGRGQEIEGIIVSQLFQFKA